MAEPSKYNVQNLKPFNELTEKEQRELASRGGKASVKARKAYKNQREALNMLLKMGVPDSKNMEGVRKVLEEFGITDEDQNLGTAMALRQVIKALSGDTVAYNAISNRADGMPQQKQDITSDGEKITGLNIGFKDYENGK